MNLFGVLLAMSFIALSYYLAITGAALMALDGN